MEIATEDLRRLLGTLPQELYDELYDYTFTESDEEVRTVDHTWQARHLLHVDRASRQQFAQSYFGALRTFLIQCKAGSENYKVIGDWLATLEDKHVEAIRGISVSTEVSVDPFSFLFHLQFETMSRLHCDHHISEQHPAFRLAEEIRLI